MATLLSNLYVFDILSRLSINFLIINNNKDFNFQLKNEWSYIPSLFLFHLQSLFSLCMSLCLSVSLSVSLFS